MRKFALTAAIFLFPSLALAAAQTWAAIGTSGFSVAGTCAAGTSCDAPTLATQGMNLKGVYRVAIEVCADSGQTITDGDGLDVYYYSATSGAWGKSDVSMKIVKGVGSRCAWIEGDSPGHGIVILGAEGRMAVIPNAMTVSSGALTTNMYAFDAKGNPL